MSELEFKPRSSMVPSLLPFTSILYFKQEQLQLTKSYEDDRHGGLKRGLPHKPRCTQLLCPGPVNTPSPSSHLINPGILSPKAITDPMAQSLGPQGREGASQGSWTPF